LYKPIKNYPLATLETKSIENNSNLNRVDLIKVRKVQYMDGFILMCLDLYNIFILVIFIAFDDVYMKNGRPSLKDKYIIKR
jgi:hypothetical protein